MKDVPIAHESSRPPSPARYPKVGVNHDRVGDPHVGTRLLYSKDRNAARRAPLYKVEDDGSLTFFSQTQQRDRLQPKNGKFLPKIGNKRSNHTNNRHKFVADHKISCRSGYNPYSTTSATYGSFYGFSKTGLATVH